MARPKLNADTQAALKRTGYRVSSIYQQPQADGRKLKRVCQPDDPWTAHVFLPSAKTPVCWHARKIAHADGATADEAVMNALPSSGGLMSSYRALGAAVDALTMTIQRRAA